MKWVRTNKNGKQRELNVAILIEADSVAKLRIRIIGDRWRTIQNLGKLNLISGDSVLIEDTHKIKPKLFRWFSRDTYYHDENEEDYDY